MRRKKAITILLLLLTLAQALIFLFRDRFQYHPYEGLRHIYYRETEPWTAFAKDNAADLPAAKRIADSVIGNEKGTTERALAIARFLHRHFYHRLGQPSPDLLKAAPLTQYWMLRNNDSAQLWCGNFAAMFALFCWSEGIPCRTLEIMRPGDHHVLNEFYLPGSSMRWVAVDLTHNLALVTTDSLRRDFLSGASLTHFLENDKSFEAWRFRGDSLVREALPDAERAALKGYYRAEYPVYYYYRTDNEKAYSFGNRLKMYFLPVSWYEILADRREENTLFYVKEALALIWLPALLAWVAPKLKL